MERLEKILKELKIQDLLKEEFVDEIILKEFKVDTHMELYGKKQEKVWYIVMGSVEGTEYYSDVKSAQFLVGKDNWFGFEEVILDQKMIYDMKIKKGTLLLELPLRKIMESKSVNPQILLSFMRHMARNINHLRGYIINKVGYSDEGFFLKYLEENNLKITYKNQVDLAEVLLINSRTLQRIIKSLEKEGIILIKRKAIEVVEKNRFYRYLEENNFK